MFAHSVERWDGISLRGSENIRNREFKYLQSIQLRYRRSLVGGISFPIRFMIELE